MQLADKLVLITGASKGIGAATAEAFAARGAHVLLVARDAEALSARAERIAAIGGRATAFPADLADGDQIGPLAERVREQVGVPDVLVNNAGVGRFLFLEETPVEELLAMTAVPYLAALLLTREFVPDMRRRGSGWLVTVNSPVSRLCWPGATGYAGARGGLRGLTTALRLDLRGSGVGVSEVVPGKVSSEYFVNNPGAEQRIPKIAALIPTSTPEQVAARIVDAVARERREVMFPWQLRAFELSARFAPRLTEWLTWRTGSGRFGPNAG
ncbi:SDR family NAD(P)-dependent oxidoreductase [Solihabitans fulvus]|uniref:SDR family NAD(P)-dependent oxidoreductase n=1 Tax=Solihabitans fulvus TaxID=1892852 RepID=A0A5B2XLF3_9PSEU|nr:SDR family NAD(P)-dependent oxidoreductase [Solihabitans fulvus]KAA2263721.1 SDR family NAD(P)-dependent oxidoreductase [Solihabitans fulvus]